MQQDVVMWTLGILLLLCVAGILTMVVILAVRFVRAVSEGRYTRRDFQHTVGIVMIGIAYILLRNVLEKLLGNEIVNTLSTIIWLGVIGAFLVIGARNNSS